MVGARVPLDWQQRSQRERYRLWAKGSRSGAAGDRSVSRAD